MNPPARVATVRELAPTQGGGQGGEPLAPWLILLAGLCFLYVPSFIDLFRTIWSTPEQAHGPIQRGTQAVKAQWFALFFVLFMIPLTGAVVAAITMPMKIAVSVVAEHVRYWLLRSTHERRLQKLKASPAVSHAANKVPTLSVLSRPAIAEWFRSLAEKRGLLPVFPLELK